MGGLLTASKISEVLEILTDGQWHGLTEIKEKTRLSDRQIEKIIAFLADYKFVAIDEGRKEIRLQDLVRNFLEEEATS